MDGWLLIVSLTLCYPQCIWLDEKLNSSGKEDGPNSTKKKAYGCLRTGLIIAGVHWKSSTRLINSLQHGSCEGGNLAACPWSPSACG